MYTFVNICAYLCMYVCVYMYIYTRQLQSPNDGFSFVAT